MSMSSAARRRASRISGGAVVAGGLSFIVAQASVNLSNFGFHAVASRLLGPNDYGTLGALLAISMALAVPVSAFETLFTARVAQHIDQGVQPDPRRAHRSALVVGTVSSAVLLGLAPVLRAYLHLESWAPLTWIALDTIPMAASVVPWGMLCGRRHFRTAGWSAFSAAALRIVFVLSFFSMGFGLGGACAAGFCSDVVRAALLGYLSRSQRFADVQGGRVVLCIGSAQSFAGIAAFAGLWLLLGTDVVVARHLLPGTEAGLYVASSTVAKISFFLPTALCTLAVPAFAIGNRARARATLAITLGGLACVGIALSSAVAVFGPLLLPVVFGSSYHFSPVLLFVVAFAATEMAMVWATVQYRLARGQRCVVPGWIGAAFTVVATGLSRPSALGLGLIAATAAAVALVAALLPVVLEANPGVRPALRAASWPLVGHADGHLDLTVVVPFYNPGDSLRPNVVDLVTALRRTDVRFEIIAVSDGCTDGSETSIADLEPGVVRHLALPRNAGKGAALRLGLAEGRGRYLGFIDADGDLNPSLWEPFLALIRLYRPDIIAGSKRHALSEIDPTTSLARRLASWGYQAMVRILFPSLPVRDTQVGIKVFRRELLVDVLPRTVEQGFVFDLELLAVARRLGYRRIMAAPVALQRKGASTIKLRTVWTMLADTMALAYRLHVQRRYDTVLPAQALGRAGDQSGSTDTPCLLAWGSAVKTPVVLPSATVP